MYRIKYSKEIIKEFKKLDKVTQILIIKWIEKHLLLCDNPKSMGKLLVRSKKGLWQYRIGNYRLICIIEEKELIVIALAIGHRKDIYK